MPQIFVHFFLLTAMIGYSNCVASGAMGVSKFSSHFEGTVVVNLTLKPTDLDKAVKGSGETHRRIESLAQCVERVNRASFERKVGVFYQRNLVSQEILVSKYLQRIFHDLDVMLHGNWIENYGDNSMTHNFVIFLHDPESFHEIDLIMKKKFVDRKGKFVICISSTLWTEDMLVGLSKKLWKFKVANAVMLVSDIRGRVRIYGYTPMEPNKCVPSRVFVLVDDCDDRNVSAKNLFERKMRNMNLCKVVASALSIEGVTTVYVENGTRKVSGSEGRAFNVIADRMNFTRVITPMPVNLWGDELPNGTWDGIHGNIINGFADVGFCLMFPAVSRLHFEEYSHGIITDKYIWILPNPSPIYWNKLLMPFELRVWLAGFAAMISAQGVMYLIARDSEAKRRVAIKLWGIWLDQSMMRTDDRRLTKYFLLCWTMFSFVFTNAYKSGLVGFLTATTTGRRFSTVEDLIQHGIPFGGAQTPAQLYNNPTNSEDYRVYENYECIPLSKYMAVVFKVIFGEINYATLVAAATLHAFKSSGKFYALKDVAVSYPSPFVFPKGSPYIAEFNIQIRRLVEGGFVDHWIRSNTTGTISHPGPSNIPLSVVHMTSIFTVWLIGISLSTLSFLTEVLCRGISRREET